MTELSGGPLPSIAFSVLDALLMYLTAQRIGTSKPSAVVAAALVVFAPAHLYYSRTAPLRLLPVAFVLAWLWCVADFARTERAASLVTGAMILGLGCYSSTIGVVLMPVYLVITLVAVMVCCRWTPLRLLAAIAAFGIPTSVGIVWLLAHHGVYTEYVQRYRIYDASHLNPLQGIKDFLNYNNVQERLSVYWDYFDPAYLFFSGGADMGPGRLAGVLSWPLFVWLPIGLRQMLRRRAWVDLVLVAGVATAPLAAVLVDERYVVRRELVIVPFAILTATVGVDYLLTQGGRGSRVVTAGLLALVPIQALGLR